MQDTIAAGAPQYNLMRQRLGPKGAATRQRILEAVVRLVDAQTGEVPSITLICKAALISKATFYQYFEDFGALVTDLLRPVDRDVEHLAQMLADDWPKDQLYDRSYAFVAAYFGHWERFRVPLRLRNLLADAGDKAMIDARLRSVDPILRVLAAKLRDARGGGRERRDDHAVAIALASAIGHAAMILTHNAYSQAIDDAITRIHGYPGDAQHRALAHLLSIALQNPEVPRPPAD